MIAGVEPAKKSNNRQFDLWLILLLAAVLRLWSLDIKAPHFDEGVNGWFVDRLRETSTFVYDPTNYHGPWHFYALFLSQSLLGRNEWALRMPVVVASLLSIPVLFMFARWFGRSAVRWAAFAFAISPACIFYGRYSIHEPWFVLFCMLFVWGVISLWRDRDKAGLWATATGLTGMILNKETYIIHVGSLALAAVVFSCWNRFFPVQPPSARPTTKTWQRKDVLIATGIMLFLLVFFYSGNFFNMKGLLGPFETLFVWTKTGTEGSGHEKTSYDLLPFVNYYWLALLARYEWPALAGLLWSIRYAGPGPAVPRLLSIFSAGILVAYSVVPYKTPWCMISILWPWFLFFGSAITVTTKKWPRVLAMALLAVSLAMSLRLNFREYENDAEPYVYVQTYNSISSLTGPLLEAARRDPRFYHTPVAMCLHAYYPLPWILGDFTGIGYFGKNWPASFEPYDAVVVESADADKVRPQLPADFVERRFRLRSGMNECTVFFSPRIVDENRENQP